MEGTNNVQGQGTKPKFKFAADVGEVKNVKEGYGARWCNDDDMNIAKKKAEGWEFVNKMTAPKAERHSEYSDNRTVERNTNKASALRYREMVAMQLPKKDLNGDGQCVESRTEAIQAKTESAIRSRILAKDGQEALEGATRLNVNATIE